MGVTRRAVLGAAAVLAWPHAGRAQAVQQPGDRFAVDPRALPAPYASPSASNPPRRVARPADATLRVPQGFVATLYSDALQAPRNFAIAPNGDVFVVESFVNRISVLRAPAGAPQAAQREVFIDGFRRPHGVQFVGDALYVADLERVWRIPYSAGDLKASARPEPVTPDGALGTQGGHFTRNLIFAPGGAHFFV